METTNVDERDLNLSFVAWKGQSSEDQTLQDETLCRCVQIGNLTKVSLFEVPTGFYDEQTDSRWPTNIHPLARCCWSWRAIVHVDQSLCSLGGVRARTMLNWFSCACRTHRGWAITLLFADDEHLKWNCLGDKASLIQQRGFITISITRIRLKWF